MMNIYEIHVIDISIKILKVISGHHFIILSFHHLLLMIFRISLND